MARYSHMLEVNKLTDLEKIYFDLDIEDIEKIYLMAKYLHEHDKIHQQLYFAICDLYMKKYKKGDI